MHRRATTSQGTVLPRSHLEISAITGPGTRDFAMTFNNGGCMLWRSPESRDMELGISPRCNGVARKTKISDALCPPPSAFPTTLPSPPFSACPSSPILEIKKALRTRRAQCFRPIAHLSAEELSGPKASVGTNQEGGGCKMLHQPSPAVAEHGGHQSTSTGLPLIGSLTCLPVCMPALPSAFRGV